MLFDKQSLFSDNQAITATAVSENVVCLAKGPLKDVALGNPLPLAILVTEAFAGLTNLTVTIETATDKEFSDATVLATTGAIAAADLVAGYTFPINFIPKGNKGYMRAKYTVSGTATAGKITAGVVASNGGGFHEA